MSINLVNVIVIAPPFQLFEEIVSIQVTRGCLSISDSALHALSTSDYANHNVVIEDNALYEVDIDDVSCA